MYRKHIFTFKNFFKALLAMFLIWYICALPDKLFECEYSTVLWAKDGELLGAKIANDGQWRFPKSDSIPKKLITCMLQFEDKNFYYHLGICPKSVLRALYLNIKHNSIKSGASTITMQTVRLMRKNPPRTFSEKILELILATRLELQYSKNDILMLYTAHAPYGNNVVGLEAASWRYFGRSSFKLSWAECATLAVLPNAPGLIFPGRNHSKLLKKRDRLLYSLYTDKIIDATTYKLALLETLPNKPHPLPRVAPHLLEEYKKSNAKGTNIKSNIDYYLQQNINEILNRHLTNFESNGIHNGAILVTAIKTGQIIAYIGNTTSATGAHSNDVNCIVAPRSTGSILKPLLYEKALESGNITPYSLLPDVPSSFGMFSPKNYNKTYEGLVPANQALAKSLNIPMVYLIKDYGLTKFHNDLKVMGMSTIHNSSKHYGLSLILGGAEATLWDLNKIYAQMAMKMEESKFKYNREDKYNSINLANFDLDKACVYSTFEAMSELNRPDEDGNWEIFETSKKIAWKTGTSFGNRDAWAIGITPDYVVSVWTGNANGEGRPGLVGLKSSAPILFEIFSILPSTKEWFDKPINLFYNAPLCKESGFIASEYCDKIENILIPNTCQQVSLCPYHKCVFLDKTNTFRVDSDCEEIQSMNKKNYFVLPPIIEKYYTSNHPDFISTPNFHPQYFSKNNENDMELLNPKNKSKILIPKLLDETIGKLVIEATHKRKDSKIYWHIDKNYIGSTESIHQITFIPSVGNHTLSLIDDKGKVINSSFEILDR